MRCSPPTGSVTFTLDAVLYNPGRVPSPSSPELNMKFKNFGGGRCQAMPSSPHRISPSFAFPGPDYLSAGDSPEPTILFGMSALFFIALCVWVVYLRRHKEECVDVPPPPISLLLSSSLCPAATDTTLPGWPNYRLHHVHHMMTILLAFKILSLFSEVSLIRAGSCSGVNGNFVIFHLGWFPNRRSISITSRLEARGEAQCSDHFSTALCRLIDLLSSIPSSGSAIGWNIVYYVFTSLRGISA